MAEPKNPSPANPATLPVLVSACLLGQACRYDGKSKRDVGLEQELEQRGLHAVPFCPEEEGGLPTPRPKAWIANQDAAAVWAGKAQMISVEGQDVTPEFKLGAQLALEECRKHSISTAILKERSPSCGVAHTHVQDQLVEGPGLTAYLLAKNGITVQGR